jgi:hypothetical protein
MTSWRAHVPDGTDPSQQETRETHLTLLSPDESHVEEGQLSTSISAHNQNPAMVSTTTMMAKNTTCAGVTSASASGVSCSRTSRSVVVTKPHVLSTA